MEMGAKKRPFQWKCSVPPLKRTFLREIWSIGVADTACGWACLYTLAATPAETIDPARFALQMVHQWDSCCFQAGNREHASNLDCDFTLQGCLWRTAVPSVHANISHYNEFVQSQLSEHTSTPHQLMLFGLKTSLHRIYTEFTQNSYRTYIMNWILKMMISLHSWR